MKLVYLLLTNDDGSAIAATNRIRLFCKGLSELGCTTHFFKLYYNKKNAWTKGCSLLLIVLNLMKIYLLVQKRDRLIFYGQFPFFNFLASIYRTKTKLYVERNEYPYWMITNAGKKKEKESNKPAYPPKGIITCSHALKEYYAEFYQINPHHCFLSPVIVDTSLFNIKQTVRKPNVISYCGDFGNNKDGVGILVQAFAIVCKRHSDYTLQLIGGSSDAQEEKRIRNLIIELGIQDKVVLTGRVKHESIPGLLINSSILALARPDNKQAEGGFPSKLAEYLSTGVPTVATNVGEIALYFKNEVDLLLVTPNSSQHFAQGLIRIIEDYDQALAIAKNGRKKIEEYNYTNQARSLLAFLEK